MHEFVDVLLRHGHHGIDTARAYGNGTSEEVRVSLVLMSAYDDAD